MLAGRDFVLKVLDGEDTIGGSKILVGWGGEGVFLDFGINYGRWGRYFEEYVKPRTAYGLGDLWKLGLVPQIRGLYRPDVVPAGLSAGDELPVQKINAVYISHAHLDHAGLAGLLDTSIPLVCSRTTASILKAVQDSGKGDLFSQSVYMSPYKPGKVGGQQVLTSDKTEDYIGRDLILTDGDGAAAFDRFWNAPPNQGLGGGKSKKGLRAGTVNRMQPSAGGVQAKEFRVDHSVLGSSGFLLESPQGPVAYSGDMRAHGEHAEDTRRFLDGMVRRPPWILLVEGTQVREREGPEQALGLATGEEDVEQNSLETVDAHRGQTVVADFAPRNIERLKSFLRIAKKTDRRLVITPKDAYLLHGMHAADASVPVPSSDMVVFDPPAGTESKWEAFILGEYADHVIRHAEIRSGQTEHILSLSYFDLKHLLDVEPERGCYIYSSSEAHSEEQAIDMLRLHNWLDHFHLKPVGFKLIPDPRKPGKLTPTFDRGFHASGHMPGDEVLDWVRRIRPEHILPVHTEHAELFAKALEGTGTQVLHGGMTA